MVGNTVFALLLGWVIGYERYSGGLAAGSQVYCQIARAAPEE